VVFPINKTEKKILKLFSHKISLKLSRAGDGFHLELQIHLKNFVNFEKIQVIYGKKS
jgi:hypothetical protein